jgi:hypothetical protein
VAYDVEEVTINATANHAEASVSGTGTKSLSDDYNAFAILVTAEDGVTTKIYTIGIPREAEDIGGDDDPGENWREFAVWLLYFLWC